MRTLLAALSLCLVFIAGSFPSSSVGAAPNFTEGMWEMNGEVKFESGMKIGGKTFPMKPVSLHYRKCLTKKDMVPAKQEKNQKCTRVSEKISGNSVSWTMKCTEPNGTTIESTGRGTYSKTTFEGKARSVMTDDQGRKSVANATMQGRRIGPCK